MADRCSTKEYKHSSIIYTEFLAGQCYDTNIDQFINAFFKVWFFSIILLPFIMSSPSAHAVQRREAQLWWRWRQTQWTLSSLERRSIRGRFRRSLQPNRSDLWPIFSRAAFDHSWTVKERKKINKCITANGTNCNDSLRTSIGKDPSDAHGT